MKRLFLAAGLALVVVGAPACGGGDKGPHGERVGAKGVPFTFILPAEFRRRPAGDASSRGSRPLAVFALDPRNLVDVRRSAPRALALDRVATQIGASLKSLGFPGARGAREEHGGRDFVVFEVGNRVSGRQTTSRLYFFTGDGRTWEIECQSTLDKAKQVGKACDGVVRSIEFL